MTTYSGVRRPDRTVEELLERYAFMRLEPDPAAMSRIRSALMVKASQGSAALPASAEPEVSRRWSLPFATWSFRRLGVSLSGALLVGVVAGGSAFASTRAGGPLYETRLWVETITLPSAADARIEAELGRAQLRLAEAAEAAAAGDEHAVAAALTAYARIVGEELGGATDAAISEEAASAILHHRTVLLSLLSKVPVEGRSGIENALAQADKAIARMTSPTPGPRAADGNGNDNTTDGNAGNAGVGSGDAGGRPADQGGASGSAGGGGGYGRPDPSPTTGVEHPKPSGAGVPGAGNGSSSGASGNGTSGSSGSGGSNRGSGSQDADGVSHGGGPKSSPTADPTPAAEPTQKVKVSLKPRSSTLTTGEDAPAARGKGG